MKTITDEEAKKLVEAMQKKLSGQQKDYPQWTAREIPNAHKKWITITDRKTNKTILAKAIDTRFETMELQRFSEELGNDSFYKKNLKGIDYDLNVASYNDVLLKRHPGLINTRGEMLWEGFQTEKVGERTVANPLANLDKIGEELDALAKEYSGYTTD